MCSTFSISCASEWNSTESNQWKWYFFYFFGIIEIVLSSLLYFCLYICIFHSYMIVMYFRTYKTCVPTVNWCTYTYFVLSAIFDADMYRVRYKGFSHAKKMTVYIKQTCTVLCFGVCSAFLFFEGDFNYLNSFWKIYIFLECDNLSLAYANEKTNNFQNKMRLEHFLGGAKKIKLQWFDKIFWWDSIDFLTTIHVIIVKSYDQEVHLFTWVDEILSLIK